MNKGSSLYLMFDGCLTIRCFVLLYMIIFSSFILSGQDQDTLILHTMDEVVLKDMKTTKVLPWTYQRDTTQAIDTYQSSVQRLFDRQAGVQSFNGENFAQDIRISIRGFGSRSAFGIRGLRVYQDGIPLTSPDGTTQMDEISGFDIQTLDVMRSGMAARFGNAAGGAIALKSYIYHKGLILQSNATQFGSVNVGTRFGFQSGRVSILTSLNHQYFEGKRDYSRSKTTNLYNKLKVDVNDHWQLEWNTSMYHSPTAEDPGALTLQEIGQNRYAANTRSIQYRAGEKVQGLSTALRSTFTINRESGLSSSIYYRKRDFEALLPFEIGGAVGLNRDFMGVSNTYEYRGWKNKLFSLGQTAEYQSDQRVLCKNSHGIKGNITADQDENVWNMGFFQQLQWTYHKLHAHQLLRYDLNQYDLVDHYLADGRQEGTLKYQNINAAFGLSLPVSHFADIFANASTSFEMPTLNELTNNPDGMSGFNENLSPERSRQVELGIKNAHHPTTSYTITMFYILVKDQIQAYELPATPGRSYYRNAPSTHR
ncbi:MAG: TonB-dependent receptor, partial [Saprospiraceae bacterium]